MNLSFIKLDINIMNDSKIKMIRSMPDGDKILVLWVGILCLGMKSGRPGIVEIGDGIPFTAETLSVELNIPLTTVKLGLKTFEKFKMIEVWEDSELFIVNFEKHQNLEKIRTAAEISKKSSKKYREKMKALPGGDGHVTVTTKTVTQQTKTKNRQRIDKDNKDTSPDEDPEESFKKFWKMYAKPVERKPCLAKWKKLPLKTRDLIFEKLPAYVQATPDRQYRKNPSTYLNNECWNDEIIKETNNGTRKNGIPQHNYTGIDNREPILPNRFPKL